jgi:predicted peptidase
MRPAGRTHEHYEAERCSTAGTALAIGRRVPAWGTGSDAIADRQCWSVHDSEVAALVRDIRTRYPIDQNAIPLTEMSMGAFGGWDVAARQTGLFSALAPVSGGGDPRWVGPLSRLQI